MHPKFIDILCCPKTGLDLVLDIRETLDSGIIRSGYLTSKDGKNVYPIVNGVPRFCDKELYADSFGVEWKKWSKVQYESENVGNGMEGHTTRMFNTITGFSDVMLDKKLVVEFGCGGGRFLDVVRRKGAVAVGIDMSMAVEPARENFFDDPDVLIVQGDILNPPFKQSVFDFGYSIGVLHHTPDPAAGLRQLVRTVKKGGQVACCVYEKGSFSFYDFPSVRAYRRVVGWLKSLIGTKGAMTLALWYSYFSATALYYLFWLPRRIPIARRLVHYLGKYFFVNIPLPDMRWRILDVFDAITPTYASTHTGEEMRKWLADAGCMGVLQTEWGDTSFVAVKS
jgi:SAM-dependent methyltransferase